MTKIISDVVMFDIKTALQNFLNKEFPEYASKISIHLDQKLDLVEVHKGMYTLSDEDYDRIRKKSPFYKSVCKEETEKKL